MASAIKQVKGKKARHKTVLKWEKEFYTKFVNDLAEKDVRLRCTPCANGKDLFVPLKTLSMTIFAQVLPQLKKTVYCLYKSL